MLSRWPVALRRRGVDGSRDRRCRHPQVHGGGEVCGGSWARQIGRDERRSKRWAVALFGPREASRRSKERKGDRSGLFSWCVDWSSAGNRTCFFFLFRKNWLGWLLLARTSFACLSLLLVCQVASTWRRWAGSMHGLVHWYVYKSDRSCSILSLSVKYGS